MSVIDLISKFATPVIVNKAAGVLGLESGLVKKALTLAVPLLLGAFMKQSSSPEGAGAFASAYDGIGDNPLGALGDALGGGGDQATAALTGGSDLLGSLLGGDVSGGLASKLAGFAGLDSSAAGSLMGLAGSMAMGGLKQSAGEQGLDAAGALKMLGEQKSELKDALPGDFLASLGDFDLSDVLGDTAGSVADAAAGAVDAATGAAGAAVDAAAGAAGAAANVASDAAGAASGAAATAASAAGSAANAAENVADAASSAASSAKRGLPRWLIIAGAVVLALLILPRLF